MPSGVADGAIIIDTGLDNKGFIRDAAQFKRAVETLTQVVKTSGQSMAQGMNGYLQALQKAGSAAKGATGDQAALTREIAKTEAAIKRLEERQELARQKFEAAREDAIAKATEKAQADNAGAEFMPWENEEQALEQLSDAINQAAQKAAEAFGVFEDSAAFRNSSVEIEYMREKLAGLQSQLASTAQAGGEAATGVSELASSGGAAGLSNAFASVASKAAQAAGAIARMAGNGALSFLKKLASGAKNAAIQLAKLAGNALRGGIQKIGGLIGGAAKSLFGFNRESQKGNNGLKQGLMAVLKYGLGIRGLFALFRKLRAAVAEGLGEIEKRNPRVKSAMDSLRGALAALRGSLGSAFAPIVTAVAPALTKLINMLTSAINTIGAFIAALTGQQTYQKAVAGLEATGSAAGGAASEVKELKRQLAGFDNLEILSANDSSSGGGGGGGGGGGSGFSYETAEIAGGVTDFVAKLKELWANADYEGIGRIIADGINSAFEKAKDWISWDNLGDKITEAVDAVTGIFNGLVDGINWTLIGETFGEGVNTLVKTVNQLLTKINWEGIGKGFADGLNGLVNTVNWDELGQLFANRINAALGVLKGAVENFGWGDAGTAFGNTVNGLLTRVNWKQLGDNLATLLNGATNALTSAVSAFGWGDAGATFANTVNGLMSKVNWKQLGEGFAKLLNGALDALYAALSGFEWGDAGANFANTVNGLLTKVNWKKLSDNLTTLLNGTVQSLLSALSTFEWGEAGEKFGKTLNSLISGFDWKGLGDLAYNALANPLGAIRRAVSEFDFSYAGSSFAETVNAFFKNPQMWEDAGTIVSESIKGLFTWGTDFLDNLDTKQLATDIKAALQNVDWKGIGQSIFNFLVAAIRAAGSLILELLLPTPEDEKELQRKWKESVMGDGAEVELKFGLNPTFEDEAEIIRQINEAISSGLETGEFHFPVGLDVPPETVNEAERTFLELWYNSHTEAPVIVTPELAPNSPTPAQLLGIDSPLTALIALAKSGWTSITNWLGLAQQVLAKIGLTKNGWTTIGGFVGTAVTAAVSLSRNGWTSISNYVGTAVTASISLSKNGWTSISNYVGTAVTAIVSLAKKNKNDTVGGLFGGTSISASATLKNADKKKYTLAAIFGTTLNVVAKVTADKKSKNNLVSTITSWLSKIKINVKGKASGGIITPGGQSRSFARGGVISGGLARYLGSVPHYAAGTTRAHGTVFVAGEAGPEIMGHINGRTEILNKSQLAQTMYSAVYGGMTAALRGLEFRVPAMATGTVLPYEVAAQVAQTGADIQGTLDANNEDLIQTIISVIGAQTSAIVAALRANQQQGSGSGMTAQQVISEINRQTQMYGVSPLKGV